MGQRCLGCGRGGRDTGAPRAPRVRQWLEVLRTVQGAIGHHVRRAIGGLPRGHVWRDDVPAGGGVTGSATARLQQPWHASLMLHHHVQQDLMQVGSMLAAVATGAVHAVGVRLRGTVVAAIDVETRALAMGQGGGSPQPLSGVGSHATGACCDAVLRERIPGAAPRIIMEMLGFDPGGDASLRRCVLQAHRHTREGLVHTAEPMEDHRFDGVAHGDKPGLRVLRCRPVTPVANAACVEHPCHTPQMIQDFTPVWSVHSRLLS